jgi:hypothetical protein
MMTLAEKIQELIESGLDATTAANVAGNLLAKEQQRIAEAQAAEREKSEQSRGVRNFHGLKVTGWSEKYARPHEGCVADNDALIFEPEGVGKDSKTGKDVLFPGWLYAGIVGQNVLQLSQKQYRVLAATIRRVGADKFAAFIEQHCGEDAYQAFKARKKALVSSGAVVGNVDGVRS